MKTLALLIGFLVIGFTAPSALAQTTFTWNSTATSGTGIEWATAANWSPQAVPTSNSADILNFISAPAAYTSDDNNGVTGFQLNELNMSGANTGAITLGTNGSGGTLAFTSNGATTPTITDTSAANVTEGISFTTTNALAISNTGGAELALTGTITNSGGMTISGTSASDLTDIVSLGGNQITTTGAITLNGGVLLTGGNHQLSGSAAAGSGGALNLNGGELASAGAVGTTNFTVTNATTVGAGATVQLGDSNHASVALANVTMDDGSTLVAGSATTTGNTLTLQTGTSGVAFSSVAGVTLTNNAIITGSNNVIYKSGTILINGGSTNSYTGTTTVDSGATLTLSNTNASHFGISGSGLTINGGTVNQTSASQIATAPVTVENGGTYGFTSGLTSNTQQQAVASLTFGSSTSDVVNLTYALPTGSGGTTSSFLTSNGALTLNNTNNGAVVLNLTGGVNGDKYALLGWNAAMSDTIFASEFAVNPADVGYTLSINGSDNQLDVLYNSPIPEPGTWFLMLGGLVFLAIYPRTRQLKFLS